MGAVIEYAVLAPMGNCGWAIRGELRQGSYRDADDNLVTERWTCAGEAGTNPPRASLVQVIERDSPELSATVRQFSFVGLRYVAHQATLADFDDAELAYSPEPQEQRNACLAGRAMQYQTQPVTTCGSAHWSVDLPAGWETTVVGSHSCKTFHTTTYGMPCQCDVVIEIEIELVDSYTPDDAAAIEETVIDGYPALVADQQTEIFFKSDWTRTYAVDTAAGTVVLKAQAHESSLDWPELAASIDAMAASLRITGLGEKPAAATEEPAVEHPMARRVFGATVDAAYAEGERYDDAILVTPNRGATWQPVELPGEIRVRTGCATPDDDVIAVPAFELKPDALPDQYVTFFGPGDATELVALAVDTTQDHEHEWYSMHCRPASIDGAWTIARTDGRDLIVSTTPDRGESFTVHRLPYDFAPGSDAGELVNRGWQDASVSLFADGDWYVAQVCAVRQSICVYFDISFHKSLIGEQAVEPVSSLFDWRGDIAISDNGHTIFEMDGQVWRVVEHRVLVAGDPEFANDAVIEYAAGPVRGPMVEIGASPSRRIELFAGPNEAVFARVVVANQSSGAPISTDIEWWQGTAEGDWQQLLDAPAVAWSQLAEGTPVTALDVDADGVLLVIPR